MAGRVAPLHICKLLLLVNVDQDIALKCFGNAGAIDLERLKDHVAIGEHDRLAPFSYVLHDVEGIGIKAGSEGIIDHETGDGEEPGFIGKLYAIALQRAEVVSVAQFGAKLLED